MAKIIISVLLALVYSIANTIVGPMIKAQDMTYNKTYTLPFILCFIICAVFNYAIFSFIPMKKEAIKKGRVFGTVKKIDDKAKSALEKIGNRRLLLIVWLFIFLSWIPAYLIFYPAVLSYDSISQVNMAMNIITNNHHPILHTWLLRVFMRFGESFLSGYEYGIGLYSLLQIILLSYALARLVVLLKKKNVSGLMVIAVALGSALWFENACMASTMTKDVLHAVFLVLFSCHFVEIATNTSEYINRKWNIVLFPIVSFLMCAFRNNGIYIYVFCFAILMLMNIKHIRKIKKYWLLTVAIILPVVIFKVYTGPVFNALGIEQGQVREALCIPIQQLQRIAVNKADELTDEQTSLMDYYIDNLKWRAWDNERQYDPFFADPAKSCFYSENYEADPKAFWAFYLKTGEQFTKEYIVAFLSNTAGYWYPGYYGYSYVEYDNYEADRFCVSLERKSAIQPNALTKLYYSLCQDNTWRDIYVIRLFFVPGFSIWILIYTLIIAWKNKQFIKRGLVAFLPLIAQFGIMMLSPMSSFRYSWPFYLMLPIVLIPIFNNNGENNDMKKINDLGEKDEAEVASV